MKKLLAILLSAMLVFSMVACSNDTPSPSPEAEKPQTELEKMDDAVTSAGDLFAGIEATKDEEGNTVKEIAEPTYDPVTGNTITTAKQTVSEDASTTTTEMTYTDASGAEYVVKDVESEKITIGDGTVVSETQIAEATSALDAAKALPASYFTFSAGENGEEIYTYEAAESVNPLARALVEESSIKKVVVTFIYTDNGVEYSYEVTLSVDSATSTVYKQEVTKETTITRDGVSVDVTEDLKAEYGWEGVQTGEKRIEAADVLRALYQSYGVEGSYSITKSGVFEIKDNAGKTILKFSLVGMAIDSNQTIRIDYVDPSIGIPFVETGSSLIMTGDSDYSETESTDSMKMTLKNSSGRVVLTMEMKNVYTVSSSSNTVIIKDSKGVLLFKVVSESEEAFPDSEGSTTYDEVTTSTITLPEGKEYAFGEIVIKNGTEIKTTDTYVLKYDDISGGEWKIQSSRFTIDGKEVTPELDSFDWKEIFNDSPLLSVLETINKGMYVTMTSKGETIYGNGGFYYYDPTSDTYQSFVKASETDEYIITISIQKGILDNIQKLMEFIKDSTSDGGSDSSGDSMEIIMNSDLASGTATSIYSYKFPEKFYDASAISYKEVSPMVGPSRYELDIKDGRLQGLYKFDYDELFSYGG